MKIAVHARNVRLSAAERARVVRRVEFALSQFRDRVRQVSVSVADENARRGGIDKACRVLARVAPLGDVVSEGAGATFPEAAGAAIDRTVRLISRNLGRIIGRKKRRVSMAGDLAATDR
ncbi:MAG: hypothetical protein DCC68_24450 [Planctomycetota bacterium]|nr:MAG: hypothetical protein DCC68_24450 [Planctomycetota bacterium]